MNLLARKVDRYWVFGCFVPQCLARMLEKCLLSRVFKTDSFVSLHARRTLWGWIVGKERSLFRGNCSAKTIETWIFGQEMAVYSSGMTRETLQPKEATRSLNDLYYKFYSPWFLARISFLLEKAVFAFPRIGLVCSTCSFSWAPFFLNRQETKGPDDANQNLWLRPRSTKFPMLLAQTQKSLVTWSKSTCTFSLIELHESCKAD